MSTAPPTDYTAYPWTTVRDNGINLRALDAAGMARLSDLRIVFSDGGSDVCYVTETDGDRGNRNAALIVAAVNACLAENPADPLSVARDLPRLLAAARIPVEVTG